ncbi:MAG: sugar phosphate isomerase/epimerase [Ruminococcaceae bacterium]|nr:sugar phosphate isomerase/epimerase [Oscillospiraceae bacterium]
MKLALQIYSLRQALAPEQIADTLAKTKAMGYDGVEWFGLMGMTPAALAEITRNAGLEFFSVHISIADILAADMTLLDEMAAAGVKYLPIGWLPEDRLAGGSHFAETCQLIRTYGAEAARRGMTVLYHNHDFDLAKYGDATRLDALYDAVPADLLGAELDTCWLYSGGVDAAAYVTKYAHRAPVIHLKDCVAGGGRAGFMPVGHGVLDWDKILPCCEGAEWVCVEQDEPSGGLDPFRCAELSAAFLREKLS